MLTTLIAACAAFSRCIRISRRMREHLYSVYIVASRSGVLYTGITSDLEHRVWQHKNGTFEGFTKKYKCNRLVCFERYDQVQTAIGREKQIKGWTRAKKITLIESMNPRWQDQRALGMEVSGEWAIDERGRRSRRSKDKAPDRFVAKSHRQQLSPKHRGRFFGQKKASE